MTGRTIDRMKDQSPPHHPSLQPAGNLTAPELHFLVSSLTPATIQMHKGNLYIPPATIRIFKYYIIFTALFFFNHCLIRYVCLPKVLAWSLLFPWCSIISLLREKDVRETFGPNSKRTLSGCNQPATKWVSSHLRSLPQMALFSCWDRESHLPKLLVVLDPHFLSWDEEMQTFSYLASHSIFSWVGWKPACVWQKCPGKEQDLVFSSLQALEWSSYMLSMKVNYL